MTIIKETKRIVVTTVLFTLLLGCSDQIDHGRHRLSFGVSEKSFPVSEEIPKWPEHWVLVRNNDEVPFFIDLDRELVSARNAFKKGYLAKTVQALNNASAWLDKQKKQVSGKHFSEIHRATGTIQKLSERIERGDAIRMEEFDRALEHAYPENLSVIWSIEKAEEQFSAIKKPSPHFARARYLLDHKNRTDAAREVRRGADWLVLVVMDSAEREDRDNLHKAITQLRNVANEIEDGTATSSADLKKALAAADRAYAFYYLHWAERDRIAKASSAWFTAVSGLADEVSKDSRWVYHKVDKGAHTIIAALQTFNQDVRHDGRMEVNKLSQMVRTIDKKIAPKWSIRLI